MAVEFGFEPAAVQPYYFISFSPRDAERISAVCREMNKRGVPVWYDKGSLSGEEREKQISAKIKNCHEVIAFITSDLMADVNPSVRNEFETANKLHKRVHVVMLDAVPFDKVNDDFKGWFLDIEALQCIVPPSAGSPGQIVDTMDRQIGLVKLSGGNISGSQLSILNKFRYRCSKASPKLVISCCLAAALLAAAVVFALILSPKYDDPSDYSYEIYGDYAVITGFSNEERITARIPGKISGKPVRKIGDGAFMSSQKLTRVFLPGSVRQIGEGAFKSCANLTTVEIPDSVTYIGDYSFSGCQKLRQATIPGSVTAIGAGAFQACFSLTGIDIPCSVAIIGDDAFSFCSSLEAVAIPHSAVSLGNNVFSNCMALNRIEVSSDNTHYSSVDGVLFDKDGKRLICFPAGKTDGFYDIPDSVEEIGSGAFMYCTGLHSVVIPDSVLMIRKQAFSYSGLTGRIDIPSSVILIESDSFYAEGIEAFNVSKKNEAFCTVDGVLYDKKGKTLLCYPCAKKGSIFTVPNTVRVIGTYAFANCSGLSEIRLSSSVVAISEFAIVYCDGLKKVVVPESVKVIDKNSFGYVAFISISGKTGSYAEQFAKENGIDFIRIVNRK